MAKARGNIMAGYSKSPVGPKPKKTKPKPKKQVIVNNIMARYSTSPAQPGSSFNSGFRPAPAAPAAPAKPAAAAPAPPPPVAPFLTAADLQNINAFTTDAATKVSGINFDLGNLETDTAYQTTLVDKSAQQNTAAANDDAAARGIFQSSIRDASLYDIEATRALQDKYLNDKLTAARLNAGTQKNIIGTSKTSFDKAMAAQSVENAKTVNDAAAEAYGATQANAPKPKPAAPPKPPGPPKPPAPPKPKAQAKPKLGTTYTFGGKPTFHTALGSFKGRGLGR